jgi:tetratricopeptide (TPR) repeat protein
LHKKIQSNLAKYDYSTGMEADEILCDFYRKTQQPDKAHSLYTRIVNNFRQVALEYEQDRRPLPETVKKSYDNAALQLGLLAMERKNSGEAIKWFENIKYDRELKQKARLYMAKLSFERQDYNSAINYLTGEGYLETVSEGPVKWDMYLIVGLAHIRAGSASVDAIESALRRVPQQARAYGQAQLTLANIYRDRKLYEVALKAYQNAATTPDYTPTALLNMGNIYIAQAALVTEANKAQELYKKAGEVFSALFTRYPLTADAKQAKEKLDLLAGKGVVVTVDTGETSLRAWEKVAREKPGTVEAAQALMSMVRFYSKKLTDEKTGKLLQAPNYETTAKLCDQLLDEKVYTGQGWSESNWKAFRCEVLFTRAQCELASLAPPPQKPNEPTIRYLQNTKGSRAADWLTQASKLVDTKQLDLVRSIEITLVEALFKSDRKEDKELAEKRYTELENNYSGDVRLQRLSVELADWYADQKRFADAGRMLSGVASRGKDLPQEDLLKILYTAGMMFSRAGTEAAQKSGDAGFWIRISPKATVALGEDNLLKSYAPLQKTVTVKPPASGTGMTRLEALLAVSQAAKIPFTWSTAKGAGSMDQILATRMIDGHNKNQVLSGEPATVAALLKQILPPEVRLTFSIGLTDGQPTLPAPKDKEDPNADAYRVIELWNSNRPDLYYVPAAAPVGTFRSLSDGKPVLFYTILQRIEAASKMRVVWSEGIDKQDKLATEFREFPGVALDSNASSLQVLNAVTDALGLEWRIVPREVAIEYFEAAKEQFNRLRQIDPKSKFGERALLSVALNFYAIKDYGKMKSILKEYLKVFDNVENENRQMATYWIGWVFEKENNFREAGNYYARAAEERIVVTKLAGGQKPLTREELKKQLSYDTQAAVMEMSSGEFAEKPLTALLEFVSVNAHLEVRADSNTQSVGVPIQRAAFKNVPIFDVFCDALDQLGLTFRVEHVNPEYAEKALFRQVVVNRNDNAMPQALEAAQALLARFPQTTRRREVYGLMIDIYKGLKDYRQVLATMEQLQAVTTDADEKQRLANEIAWIYFDVADYERALKAFDTCLATAQDPQQRVDLREGYARAAYRGGKLAAAREAYVALRKEDNRPLRQFINNLQVFLIGIETGQADERDLPRDAEKHLVAYEQLTEALRAKLDPTDVAKATWVYFALARRDLKKGYIDEALKKLNACANSTDDNLAAEALYELGAIHLARKNYNEARDALEELLFRGKGTDTLVRGGFALGRCYEEMGRPDKAKDKFQQILDRYPLSPLADEVKKNPMFAAKEPVPKKP